jgi:Pyruvate/2-oxoacid:ferredoxin oxidoreductase gamma subunit
MRAYNRVDSRPIRRHDGVRAPAVVVVLDPALVPEGGVADGLGARGLLLVNWAGAGGEAAVGAETGFGGRIVAVDASALARRAGSRFANTVLVGALAALLGEPGPDDLDRAARALFAPPEQAALAAARRALALGIGSMAGRERGDVPWSA